jgi:hypothetical protein
MPKRQEAEKKGPVRGLVEEERASQPPQEPSRSGKEEPSKGKT